MLLDDGTLQAGEPNLAGTARRPVLRLSATTAHEIGAAAGDLITVTGQRGSITLPLVVTVMADRVVWVPMKSPRSAVRAELGSPPEPWSSSRGHHDHECEIGQNPGRHTHDHGGGPGPGASDA
ncbi:MAG: molybdopterin dinucleotide binding domain-containing protein [Geodermatophilaceae bacterium]